MRYLDAWTPIVLRAHRRATYIDASRDIFAAAALRVFGEFADRIAGHELGVVILRAPTESLATVLTGLGEPPGLSLRSVQDPGSLTVTGPVLAHLDIVAGSVLDEPALWRLVTRLAPGKAREVLLIVPQTGAAQVAEYRARLHDVGLTCAVAVELADVEGHVQLLLFATADTKHLTRFKDELWAADEFAGIRYRDPRDPRHTLIDISLSPQLHHLREALLAELARRGRCTVAELQQYTERETIYRAADAARVLTTAASAGTISRDPPKGRMSPRTIVRVG